MNYVALGSRIRLLRKQKKLTQEQFAELCDISMSFLGHIERGTRKASLETVVRIAGALKCSVDELLAIPYPAEADPKQSILFHLSTAMELVESQP